MVPVIEAAEEIKGDEFWDYDQQVDLEAFSTKDFYTTLAKQTSDVTAALARQKDQVSYPFWLKKFFYCKFAWFGNVIISSSKEDFI